MSSAIGYWASMVVTKPLHFFYMHHNLFTLTLPFYSYILYVLVNARHCGASVSEEADTTATSKPYSTRYSSQVALCFFLLSRAT